MTKIIEKPLSSTRREEIKQTLDSQVIVPQAHPNDGFEIYEHKPYQRFEEKVYYAKNSTQLRERILSDINKQRKVVETPNYTQTLCGDIKEEYYLDMKSDDNFMHMLKNHLSNITNNKVTDLLFGDCWVNFQRKNELQPLHNHNGVFSFVWYLDIPKEINEECYNQTSNSRNRGIIVFLSEHTGAFMKMNPSTDDMFIFRANHQHMVYPFTSDVTRISLSGNITSIKFSDGREFS